ncbi:MAG: tetratricopeptide repeat protein [Anaerolineae bacterium]|nr:tetratricopeptide repeat protein [Anaerolineae bacterium]
MQQLIANRYQLHDQLGAGGMGTVFRADDRLMKQQVALKRVILAPQVPGSEVPSDSQNFRVALSNEFRTLASLRHPNVISVMDYGFDSERQPYFTMTLLENARTIVEAGAGKSQTEKVNLIVQMLQALAYLHRRGVIHRDLKPGNVLVTVDGQVKVLDFGLAAVAHPTEEAEGGVAGTMHYMAPEVLTEGPATAASDLYAVGVIACELLQGQRPFEEEGITQLIIAILNKSPDVNNIDAVLRPAIRQLLAKSPEERYQTAEEVIEALTDALGEAIPEESAAIRESFLQASKFVGREAEFAQLAATLKAVIADNKAVDAPARAWLIGGESGIGKSRLVDELRVRALVQGVLVLQGQGVAEGGLPYQLWQDVLRRLVIATDPSNLEASIIKEIVPDIGTLLGREVPNASPIEGKPGQRRLVLTIADLFRRHTQPILLILEDLQWTSESLEVLKQLNLIISDLHLMIVGTYRNDESPDLPKELPGMQVLTLKRLTIEGITKLSTAMLGEAGAYPEVVEFIQRETEGNAFFIVEVMRALAEEAGRLSEIGRRTLPEKVFAGGVQEIVRRRLARVPESGQALLKRAAVAGRQLDLAALKLIADKLGTSLDEWLTTCANVAVLEVQDGQWRFAHDKLREALLKDLTAQELPTLHREVADALEKAYPGDISRAATLMEHWYAAGDNRQGTIEAQLATKVALGSYVPREALQITERALARLPEEMQVLKLMILRQRGEALDLSGDFTQAIDCFETSLAIAERLGDRKNEAELLRVLGYFRINRRSEHEFGNTLLERALKIFRTLGDRTGIAITMANLAWTPYTQGDYVKARKGYEDALAIQREISDQAGMAGSMGTLGIICASSSDYPNARKYFEETIALQRSIGNQSRLATALGNYGAFLSSIGDYVPALAYLEQGLAIEQAAGNWYSVAISYYNLSLISTSQGDYTTSLRHLTTGLKIARDHADPRIIAYFLGALGSLQDRLGDLPSAEDYTKQAIDMFKELNDRQNLAMYLSNQSQFARYKGEFEIATQRVTESLTIYEEIGDRRGLCFALTSRARLAFMKGDLTAAKTDADEALRIRRELEDRETISQSHNLLGLVALQQGDLDGAQSAFKEAIKVYEETDAKDGLAESKTYLAFYLLAQKDAAAARATLREVAAILKNMLSVPSQLDMLAGIARLHLLEGRAEHSAELVGMIEAHPIGKLTSIQHWIKPLRTDLEAALPPEGLNAAIARGKSLNFTLVIEGLDKELT